MTVDISKLKPGDFKRALWRKQPVFILRRTPEMIKMTTETDPSTLEDPAKPQDRYIKPDLYVSLGICTHLGCTPLFRADGLPGLKQPGFYCPCHGGEYDTLGRRLAGPPPENLHLLPYRIMDNGTLEIGTETFSGFSADIRKIEKLPKV